MIRSEKTDGACFCLYQLNVDEVDFRYYVHSLTLDESGIVLWKELDAWFGINHFKISVFQDLGQMRCFILLTGSHA